jgi:hypothetical protein
MSLNLKCHFKVILSLIIAMALLDQSNAQGFRLTKCIDEIVFKPSEEIVIGVGPNFYNIRNRGSSTDIVFIKPGFTAFAELTYHVKNQLNLSTRLFYDYKGYVNRFDTQYFDDNTGSILNGKVKAETFLKYTGIALLARFKIKNTNFDFDAGPVGSYFIKGKAVRTFLWNNSVSQTNIDEDNRFSIGLSFSAGYNILIKNSLGLSFRIIENMNLFEYSNDTIVFQIGVKLKN